MAAVIGGIVVAAGAAYAANKQASAQRDAAKRASQEATLTHNPYLNDTLQPYIKQLLQAQQDRFNAQGGGAGSPLPSPGGGGGGGSSPVIGKGGMTADKWNSMSAAQKRAVAQGTAGSGGSGGGGGNRGGKGLPAANAATQAQDLFNTIAQKGLNYQDPNAAAANQYVQGMLGSRDFSGSNSYLAQLGNQLTGPQGTSFNQPIDLLMQFLGGGGGAAYPGNTGLPGLPQQSGAPYNDFGIPGYSGGSQPSIPADGGGGGQGGPGAAPQMNLPASDPAQAYNTSAPATSDPYASTPNAKISGADMAAQAGANQTMKDAQTKGVLSDKSRYLQSQGMDPAMADQVAGQSGAGVSPTGGTYISNGQGGFYVGKPIGGWTDTQSPPAPNIPGSPGPNAAGGPFPATAQNPIADATGGGTFGQQISKFFDPSRLDPANDPTLKPYIDSLKQDAEQQFTDSMSGINSSAEAGGRFGSGMWQHAAALAQGQSDRAFNAAAAQAYLGSRQQALQDQMNALGMINSRDVSAMQDKTSRYGIDTQAEIARANNAAAGASAAAQLAYEREALAQQGKLATRGQNLNAIEDVMRQQQFGMGLQSQLGGQLQAGQLGALSSIPGLAQSGLSGMNLALGGAQGLEGLAGQAAGIRQAQIGASAANANARLAQQQFQWQQGVYNQQLGQQNINDYLRTIQAIGGMGSTNTGPASALGVSTPSYGDPGASAVMAGLGGFQTGAGLAGMFGPSAAGGGGGTAPYSASYMNSQNPGLNPQYGYGTNFSNLY